ncbi:active regulator of SIRT1-like [Anneissia japonica]|uniref:active regulator of SIRT1-like n=1 Tax=Anneissia japonica TaxID=1529436 RepID=UPI001425608C|nr:active regulator of SIRT1-like [Anneissia japonica]
MTSSLVRKGLELFSDDLHANESNPKDTISKVKQKEKNKNATKRKNQKQKQKKFKSAIETYVQKQPEDQTDNNLAYFLSTSQYHAPNYDKIMKHLKGRMAKNQDEEEKDKEAFTGFTDEDFTKFEKEYLG